MKKILSIFLFAFCFFSIKSQNIECEGNLVSLPLKGYKVGQIQWQYSNDSKIWNDLDTKNSEILEFNIIESGFFRAKVSYNQCVYYSDTTQISVFEKVEKANAGSDYLVFNEDTTVQLNANMPEIGNGKWSIISGIGGFFDNDTIYNSNFHGNNYTTYVLRWTISGDCNSAFDETTIYLGNVVKDNEENIYTTIKIGTQTWMAENLKTRHLNNGDTIPTTRLNLSGNYTAKFQWIYNNDTSYLNKYGRLYTWNVVTDTNGICPIGWHIPSDSEFDILINYLGGNKIAGGKLKSKFDWNKPNSVADNFSGFKALPAGMKDVTTVGFFSVNQQAGFWSSTVYYSTNLSWYRLLVYNSLAVQHLFAGKNEGRSVRCIKD